MNYDFLYFISSILSGFFYRSAVAVVRKLSTGQLERWLKVNYRERQPVRCRVSGRNGRPLSACRFSGYVVIRRFTPSWIVANYSNPFGLSQDKLLPLDRGWLSVVDVRDRLSHSCLVYFDVPAG
jgi:hypothetical protein